MLMYKNIIYFFSFSFILLNVRIFRVRENQRRPSCTHRSQDTNLWWNLSGYIRSGHPHKFLWSHLHPTAYMLHVDMPPPCMPPMQILLVAPPSYRLHVACGYASSSYPTHANSPGRTSILPPTRCMWTCLLLA